jgi:DNA-binding NtrC family response regulator
MINTTIRGSHPVIQAILTAAERIAEIDAFVQIVGEKGTGKELLARHIHAVSRLAKGPFVRVDCEEVSLREQGAGLDSSLARNRAGTVQLAALLERAHGGTLYLDHIDAFEPPHRTPEVLATLEAGLAEMRLVGAREHPDGEPAWLAGTSLAVVEIPVPALRQRRSDIPELVEHFLELYSARHGVGPCRIDNEALVRLWQYDWPGNVRELESVLERVVVLSRSGVIGVADLPAHIRSTGRSSSGSADARSGNGAAPPR